MYLLTYYELYVNDWPPMADGQGKRSNWHDLYDSVDLVICEYQHAPTHVSDSANNIETS